MRKRLLDLIIRIKKRTLKVETTAEGKSALSAIYKRWAKRLRI